MKSSITTTTTTTIDRHLGLLNLVKTLSFLVVFVAGVVIGMTASSQINSFFVSQAKLYFYNSNINNHLSPLQIPSPPFRNCFSSDPNSIHRLPDELLFWRASMVPRMSSFPFPRVPKVAFLFLTRGPLPLLPLWDRFFLGHADRFSIYVHAPPGYHLNVSIHSPFYRRQILSKEVRWGTVTLADAERRLLANALLDFSNERFVLVSESCIPIYNFPTVYKYLIDSDYSFVESYDDPSRYGRGRYSRSMLPDIQLYQWRKGSQWFEVSRELAISIVADTKYYMLFRKYCKPSCYPDEHYIQTFLNMFYGSQNSNRSVTWVDWSMGGPHPATLGASNITEEFIQTLRNNGTECPYNSEKTRVCYLFARKFAPSALEPLLNLTTKVMEF